MTPPTNATLKLTDEDTRHAAIERLSTYFPLQVSGYECTAETVFDVLVKAAVTGQTIETACNDLDNVVDGETIRGYLNEQVKVDDLHSLEQQVNQALVPAYRDASRSRSWKSPSTCTMNRFMGTALSYWA